MPLTMTKVSSSTLIVFIFQLAVQTYNNAPTYASRGSPIYKFKVL